MKHLYPTGEGFIHDYPTAEIDVSDDTAKELLAYHPPIFSLKPTGWPPPVENAEATEAPENPGLPDSTPEA